MILLKSYLLVCIRNLKSNNGGTTSTMVGAILGITVALFVFTYVSYESSYDSSFESNSYRYRVEHIQNQFEEDQNLSAFTPFLIGPSFMQAKSQIASFTRLIPYSENKSGFFKTLVKDSIQALHYTDNNFYADASIVSFFELKLIVGNESTFERANAILISETTAKRLFKNAPLESIIDQPMNSSRTGTQEMEFIIKGVFEDLPANSHIQLDMVISMKTLTADQARLVTQNARNTYTYLLSNQMISKESNLFGKTEYKNFQLRPIEEIHLAHTVSNNPEPSINPQTMLFLLIAGVLILMISSGNYVNNTLVNSADRSLEIGIRKLAGARPYQLIVGTLTEGFIINMAASFIALILLKSSLTIMMNYGFLPKRAFLSWSQIPTILLLLVLIVFLTTVLSSLYPAIFLSKINPIRAIKSKFHTDKNDKIKYRVIKSLIIFQLSVACFFLISLNIIRSQFKYMMDHDGSSYQLNVVAKFPGLPGANTIFSHQMDGFLSKYVGNEKMVTEVSFSNLYRGSIKTVDHVDTLMVKNTDSVNFNIEFEIQVIDHQYFADMSHLFLSGKNFNPKFGSTPNGVLVNSSAMLALGIQHVDSIINKEIGKYNGYLKVLGVVESNDRPTIFVTGFRYPTYVEMTVFVSGSTPESTSIAINQIERRWGNQMPHFYVIDRNLNAQSDTEHQVTQMFIGIAFLGLLISLLSIKGLSGYLEKKRNKEVHIRKILGANAISLSMLLLKETAQFVLIGGALAIPVAQFLTKEWLANYAYRIELNLYQFTIPVLAIFLFAVILIGNKTWTLARKSALLS